MLRRLMTAAAIGLAVPAVAGPVEAAEKEVPCQIVVATTPVPGDPGANIAIVRLTVPPGGQSHPHAHYATEVMTAVSGTGSLTVEGRGETPLSPGTIVVIPPDVPHHQRNHSSTEPLVYTATLFGHLPDPLRTRYVGEPEAPTHCR